MGYYNHNYISFLSNVDHEFSNLFRKICPLIYQNLITCWKCSRGFFAFLLYQKHAGYEVANKLVLPTFSQLRYHFLQTFPFTSQRWYIKCVLKVLCSLLFDSSSFSKSLGMFINFYFNVFFDMFYMFFKATTRRILYFLFRTIEIYLKSIFHI